jgi:hypothetical protein
MHLDQQYKYQDYQSTGGYYDTAKDSGYYQTSNDRQYTTSYQKQEERALILGLGVRLGMFIAICMIVKAIARGISGTDDRGGGHYRTPVHQASFHPFVVTSKSTDEKLPYSAMMRPLDSGMQGPLGGSVSFGSQKQYFGDVRLENQNKPYSNSHAVLIPKEHQKYYENIFTCKLHKDNH